MSAYEQMQKFCLSLPDTSEGAHFGAAAFKVGGKMFATYEEKKGVVVQLEPDHWQLLIDSDSRVARYPQAKHCIVFRLENVKEWKELVRESYGIIVAREKPKKAAKAKPKSARRR